MNRKPHDDAPMDSWSEDRRVGDYPTELFLQALFLPLGMNARRANVPRRAGADRRHHHGLQQHRSRTAGVPRRRPRRPLAPRVPPAPNVGLRPTRSLRLHPLGAPPPRTTSPRHRLRHFRFRAPGLATPGGRRVTARLLPNNTTPPTPGLDRPATSLLCSVQDGLTDRRSCL